MSHDNKPSLAEKMAASAKAGTAKAAAEVESSKVTVQSYQGNHVKRLVLANGDIVLPNEEGVFIPKSQEEYDMLEHLAASTTCSLERID
jgi:hypothetical protein